MRGREGGVGGRVGGWVAGREVVGERWVGGWGRVSGEKWERWEGGSDGRSRVSMDTHAYPLISMECH